LECCKTNKRSVSNVYWPAVQGALGVQVHPTHSFWLSESASF
jgi:hypothetical protein